MLCLAWTCSLHLGRMEALNAVGSKLQDITRKEKETSELSHTAHSPSMSKRSKHQSGRHRNACELSGVQLHQRLKGVRIMLMPRLHSSQQTHDAYCGNHLHPQIKR
jgi:hypothetical protein